MIWLSCLHARCSKRSTGFELVNTSMQILPDTFAPKELCDCLPGWNPACSSPVFFCFRVKESVNPLLLLIRCGPCFLNTLMWILDAFSWSLVPLSIFCQCVLRNAAGHVGPANCMKEGFSLHCAVGLHILRTGNGTHCRKCPINFFNEKYSGECKGCPPSSTSPAGSTSYTACRCRVGEIFNKSGALWLTWRLFNVLVVSLCSYQAVKESLMIFCRALEAIPVRGFDLT